MTDGPVAVLRGWRSQDGARHGTHLYMWCPGCDELHAVETEGEPCWQWDGNLDAPTVSPSIKVSGVQWAPGDSFYKPLHAAVAAGEPVCCHSYVRSGCWEFLGDCTHTLAGQTVPLPPLPDWFTREGEEQ